jgi:hypothetical protein
VSDFFKSEIVRETMEELADMQQELVQQIFQIPFLDSEGKKKHLDLMKEFLEKQKILFFRMSLSDDPEAQKTKNQILESAKSLGLKEGQGMEEFFKLLEDTLLRLEQSLDD